MAKQGAHVIGHETLAHGSIITGMIWGGFTALIIDGKLRHAGYFCFAAAAMSSVGILHAPALQFPAFTEVVIGYLVMGVFLVGYPLVADVVPLDVPDPEEPKPGAQEADAPRAEDKPSQ